MRRSKMLAAAGVMFAGIVLGAGIVSHAGPLDPPAGPVAPSFKTLTSVEPRIEVNATNTPGDAVSLFKITAPGSYYLSGNITGVSGKSGIRITSSNVTIELNGFLLAGVTGSLNGIETSGVTRTTVRNGNITNWGGSGFVSSSQCTVERVIAASNGGGGIAIGSSSLVRDCTANQNGLSGILTGVNSLIEMCNASGNTNSGISVSQSTVIRCTVNNNGTGIDGGTSSNVLHCNAQANKGDGIRVGSNCRVADNLCTYSGNSTNDGANIHVTGSENRIESNNVTAADRGIDIDLPGNIVLRNTAAENTVNYAIVAGNSGQYISAAAASAINGASGGTAIGSTDPWVNFSY